MAEEGALRFAEYTVAKRAKGKNLRARIALVAAYTLFGVAYCVLFTAVILLPQLIAVLPVLLVIFVLATWRFVRYDITAKLDSGVFTVVRGGGKGAKTVVHRPVREAAAGGPLALLPPGTPYCDLRGDPDSGDGWFLSFPDGQTVVFEATRALVAAIRYYAPQVDGNVSALRY